MEYVFQRKHADAKGKTVKSKYWTGRYKLAGDVRPKEVALHCRDKQVAEQKLRQIVQQEERGRAGLVLPVAQTKCLARPLGKLIDEFIDDKDQVGRAESYTRIMAGRLYNLSKACGWHTLADVDAQSFLDWRRRQRTSAKTLNEYLGGIRRLLAWVRKQYGVPITTLDNVEYVDERGAGTFERRALTLQEAQRLLNVAPPERRLIYVLALSSGLRRAEMESLTWGNVELDAPQPFLRVRAKFTKNRKDAFIPLIPQAAEVLRAVRPMGVSGSAAVLPKGVPRNRRALRRDMKAAGIPIMDGNGRKFDLHAMRTTCCTFLLAAGVPARLVQEIMRHSDIRLTTKNYADMSRSPLRESMNALAPLVTLPAPKNCTLELSPDLGSGCHFVANDVILSENGKPAKPSVDTGDFADCRYVSCNVAEPEMVEAEGLEPTTR
jgi:integrase